MKKMTKKTCPSSDFQNLLSGNSSCPKIEKLILFSIEFNDHTGLQQKPSDKFFIHQKNSCFNLAPIYP